MFNKNNKQIGIGNINLQGFEEDLGIINEIYEMVLNKEKENLELSKDRDFLDINKKIELNIKNKLDRERIKKLFESIYDKISLIEKTISELDASQQRTLSIDIKEQYHLAMKETNQNVSDALDKMIKHYTPEQKSKNPSYNNLARAFVLFFFDDCTIGRKNKC